MDCRSCDNPVSRVFADLGLSPLANGFVPKDRLDHPEMFYPLKAFVCDHCLLVQLDAFEKPEQIFSDYAYFSSYSDSWLEHARKFAEEIPQRLALDPTARIVEVASNDGYLLRFFAADGYEVLGIEPAANVAAVASNAGVPTLVRFFGADLASELVSEGGQADLIIANNVLAHVPDLNGFIVGLKRLLGPGGTISVEFPHLLRLIEHCEWDTIYHEHFSYFSLLSVQQAFARHGLTVVDVDELETHGGSLRILIGHQEEGRRETQAVARVLTAERETGLDRPETYDGFQQQVDQTKRALLRFLIEKKEAGAKVVGYGAPAKGNTLLNHCGVGTDLLSYTVDRSPHKQGHALPGTRIPVHPPERIFEDRPDYILILPWNLRSEIIEQLREARSWGAQFVLPIPTPTVIE